jgi:hypothetical protein
MADRPRLSRKAGLGLAVAVAAAVAIQVLAQPRPTLRALLIKAARATPVSAIDYDQRRCDTRTVEQWLKSLSGPEARSISWTAGPCQITGPGIDAGSRWCAQGRIALARPKSTTDRPMVEVFFEAPKDGRPGRAYAFRGLMQALDGVSMSRYRKDFEYDWTTRFRAPKGSIVDCAAG